MRPVLIGLCVGIAAAVGVGRLLSSQLYSVAPGDLATIACVIAVTLVAAFLASVLPARRAVNTSPLRALQFD
jgi:ABC-type antimicrobial peptide transport system permease subunit